MQSSETHPFPFFLVTVTFPAKYRFSTDFSDNQQAHISNVITVYFYV